MQRRYIAFLCVIPKEGEWTLLLHNDVLLVVTTDVDA